MILETVKIMSSSKEQGEFVLINKADFDPEVHTLYGHDADAKPAMSKAELQAALDDKGIEYKPAMSKAELQSLLTPAV